MRRSRWATCGATSRRRARGCSPRCAARGSPSRSSTCRCGRRVIAVEFIREGYAMLKYTQDHEWLSLDGDVATVGITQFAQKQLGDLVFVELPSVGTSLDKGAVAATVESVKAASEVYAPIGGEVIAVNDRLSAEPGLVNAEP